MADDDAIAKLKAMPISLEQIKQIAPRDSRVVMYSELAQMESLRDLFRGTRHVILHIPIGSLHEGHWVCILVHSDGLVEYHDSYGRAPDDAILHANDEVISELEARGVSLTELGRLLSGHRVCWSNVILQRPGRNHQECGYFTACRLGHSRVGPEVYLDWITGQEIPPETVAFLYCMNKLEGKE